SNELAEMIEMSPAYIRQIECGNRKPSLETLIVLCNTLHVSPEYLLEGDLKPLPKKIELEDRVRVLNEQEKQVLTHFLDAVEAMKH
ncbi:MAG: helix-turn-helix transcriptional regulator, partial [Candidatus Saccharibacteria bacterium]|nr:helix-turn-helix transcriptional regulator [Candidatus Saccharibacteria bacterium]